MNHELQKLKIKNIFALITSLITVAIYISSFNSTFQTNGVFEFNHFVSVISKILFEFFIVFLFISLFNSRIFAVVISLIFSFFITFNIYINFQYGGLKHGIVASFINSNLNESFEFILSQNLTVEIGIFCIALFSLLSVVSREGRKKNSSKFLSLFVSVFLIIALTGIYKGQNLKEFLSSLTPTMANANIVRHTLGYIEIENEPINPNWGKVNVSKNSLDYNYIVIIGESVQRKAFPLYNNRFRDDNERLEGWSFITNAISPSNLTRYSVPRMLAINTDAKIDYNKNIIDLSRSAGLKTFWFSNQGSIGKHDTPIVRLAKRSDYYEFYNHAFANASSDNKLLLSLEQALSDNKTGNVVFLHMIGSHSNFCNRVTYHKEDPNYLKEDPNICYQDSVNNTFDFIKAAEIIAKNHGNKYKLIYFSDHGLIDIDRLPYKVHGIGSKFSLTAVEVPLVVINSDQKIKYHVDKSTYFLRDFPHYFSELIGIENKHINEELSLHGCNLCQERYVYDGELKVSLNDEN